MGVLDGIKVIDMCSRLPGALSAMYLGDFGADVLKVDAPGSGTAFVYGVEEDKLSANWSTDRNKRSMVINLKTEEGIKAFKKLAAQADVIFEGNRPGVMHKMGIGYDDLCQDNPGLIYCNLSGFGQDGPYKMMPAHDMNFVALSGAMSMIGEKDGQPYMPSNLVADIAGAGLHGLIGVLLALIARQNTGRGQFVDVAYFDATFGLLTFDISSYFASGVCSHRGETQATGSEIWGSVYRCKDGQYFCLGAAEPKLWANLCNELGCPELIEEQWPTDPVRKEELRQQLADIFATKTRDEWFEITKQIDTCATPVYNIDEAVKDPQVIARDMVVEFDDPERGKCYQTGIPIKLSDTPGEIRFIGVPKGTNTDEVLKDDLGYTDEEIAAFHEGHGDTKVPRA